MLEDSKKIIGLLRKADIQTLYQLAGPIVVKAVRSAFNSDVEAEIAEVVFLRHGHELLSHKEIRKLILDILESSEVQVLCEQLHIDATTDIQRHTQLQDYFETFTPEKSKVLADYLSLGPDFYLHPEYDTRKEVELLTVDYGEALPGKPFLHSYQKRIKDKMLQRLGQKSARFLIQMPTGAGKTYTALEAVVDILRKPLQNSFVVWLVDSNDLCEQALSSFRNLWRLKGDCPRYLFRLYDVFEPDFRNYQEGGVVFAGFDKLFSIISTPSHSAYEATWHLVKNTTLLIIDEAHAVVAETRQECADVFIGNSVANVVGLTATPARNAPEETQQLSKTFSGSLLKLQSETGGDVSDPISYLQNEGYLARIEAKILESGIGSDEINEHRILDALAADQNRNTQIMEQIVIANDAREPTLVFACTKEHVFALRVLCKARGIPVEHITGEIQQSARPDILERFRRGEYFILINLDILSMGIDVPNVQKLIITRPIASRIQYSQILGRALRGPRNGGNAKNTVVNVRDNLKNYPEANMLYEWFAQEYCSL